MNFQQRLIWTLIIILSVNFVGYWVSAFFHVDISSGPDPSQVVLAILGLIGTVWGGSEFIAANRKRQAESQKKDEDDAR